MNRFVVCTVFLCELLGGMVLHAEAEGPSLLDDATILAHFDEMNTTDIWLARMAVHQAATDGVREIGRMIVEDHEKIQAKARALAGKLKIIPRSEPTDHSAARLAELVALVQSKTGPEFDRAYLTHELEFSEAFLAMLKERMVPAAQRKEIKDLLAKLVPEFEHHLANMRETARQLHVADGDHGWPPPSHHHQWHDYPGVGSLFFG